MRLRKYILSLGVLLLFTGWFFVDVLGQDQDPMHEQAEQTDAQESDPDPDPEVLDSLVISDSPDEGPKEVDFKADRIHPVPAGDSTAMSLVGNVVFHHNGAVITCDSAVRYSSSYMECFRNVIINKDSTYVYGDRADYNGDMNLARVYSPLVKMIDKDAVLYTYYFSFNTLDNMGHYTGGGTMSQNDNMLESQDGYYYTDTRELICVGDVEMRNEKYTIKSDSVTYDMNTEIANFHTRAWIWNEKDELLTALCGEYDSKADKYFFTDQAYIMTASQEVWADTIDYYAAAGDALLLSNVQIRDDEQNAMAFGDYAQYWGESENALLTRDPSVLNFDPQEPDTMYMRSDSVFIFTIRNDSLAAADMPEPSFGEVADSLAVVERNIAGQDASPSETIDGEQLPAGEEMPETREEVYEERQGETLVEMADEPPALSTREQKRALAEQKRLERDARIREKQKAKDAEIAEKQRLREEKEHAREVARALKRGLPPPEHLHDHEGHDHADSLALADSVALADSTGIYDGLDVTTSESAAAQTDSVSREIRAYNNVRIFRTDFQAVCDSLVGFSIDSTMYMYTDPIMWNDANQITSEFVQVFTKNRKIDSAIFTGDPIMGSRVADSVIYNQIKGKVMEAYFDEGAIYRMDVVGNAQTYYYFEEGDSTFRYANGFMTLESADITFMFAEQRVDKITWRGNPDYVIYPLELIPDDQPEILPGFEWRADRRPAKEDVFTRKIVPSRREEYGSLPRPMYLITEMIEGDKKRLLESGEWFDRNDTLSDDAVDFIRSLGY